MRSAVRPTAHLVVLLASLLGAPLAAQEPDTVVAPDPAPEFVRVQAADAVLGPEPVSPRTAFLRSLALPGWGHASVESYSRGAFYFSAESAVGWMLYRSVDRYESAERVLELRRAEAAARLRSEGVLDPRTLEAAVAEDPLVQAAEGLLEARREQREDWIALGIFLLLLGAADAYVSAHLQEIPEPIRLDASALPGGRWSVGVRVPVSAFRAR